MKLKEIQNSSTWKDAVWSKVISNLIWAAIVAIFGVIYLYWSKIPYQEFLQLKVEVFWILIGGGILFLLNLVIGWVMVRVRKPTKTQIIRDEIQKINSTKGGEFYWTWEIQFYENFKFGLKNLTPYCNKHTPRMKLVASSYDLYCPVCHVIIDNPKRNDAEHIIISMIENKIEELKKTYGLL